MVEYFDDLLSGHGFFQITVHRAEGRLLSAVILFGEAAEQSSCRRNKRYGNHNDGCQHRIGGNHKDQSSDQHNDTGYHGQQRVADHNVDIVHIVCEAGHDLTCRFGIEIPDRQILQLCKQIITEFFHNPFRHLHHQAALDKTGSHTDHINGCQEQSRCQDIMHRFFRACAGN